MKKVLSVGCYCRLYHPIKVVDGNSYIPLEQCEKPLTQKGFIESLGKLKMARGK